MEKSDLQDLETDEGHATPKTPDFRMAGNCLAMPSNHKAPMLVHNNCCQLLAFKTKHRRQDKSWLSSYKISSTGLHLPMVNFSASGVLFTVPHLDKTSETKMLFLVFFEGDQSLSLYLNPPKYNEGSNMCSPPAWLMVSLIFKLLSLKFSHL